MYLFSLTEEKTEELQNKFNNKEEELAVVKATTEIEMWKKDLEEFTTRYKKHKEEQVLDKQTKPKKGAKKVVKI